MKYYEASRTLCLFDETEGSNFTLTIALSTSSPTNIKFEVIVKEIPNFAQKIEETNIINDVQVGSPHFYFIDPSQIEGKSLLFCFQPLNCKKI